MTLVRTRFAPSPTGFLHVGGLRTALYAYLFARKHHGSFILRIEDTDQSRSVPGAVENLITSLEWAGLIYDEGPHKDGPYGPYVQSQRLALYQEHAQKLLNSGNAYYCFCSPERLDQLRQAQIAAKLPPAYDMACRELELERAQNRIEQGERCVIRMKTPLDGDCIFNDLVRGTITINYKNVDDQVLIKSDGFPTYHLAVVVDDHFMKTSHIIRGEEWLSSTPKHLLLYRYFDWQPPLMAHLPLLLNPDKSKLSKRQGDVAVEEYRDKGYLKEALINFIALLGWNPGDTREIFSLEELIQEFSFERVGKSGAIFNTEKLLWLNQQHLRAKNDEALIELLKPLLVEKKLDNFTDEYLKKVIQLSKDRVTFIRDFIDQCPYFYQDPEVFDEAAKAKSWTSQTPQIIANLKESYEILASFESTTLEAILKKEAEKWNIPASKIIHPVRLALCGQASGPGLYQLIETLGKQTVIRRLNYALKQMNS
jgi:glutamyl-tRNA synthetase